MHLYNLHCEFWFSLPNFLSMLYLFLIYIHSHVFVLQFTHHVHPSFISCHSKTLCCQTCWMCLLIYISTVYSNILFSFSVGLIIISLQLSFYLNIFSFAPMVSSIAEGMFYSSVVATTGCVAATEQFWQETGTVVF